MFAWTARRIARLGSFVDNWQSSYRKKYFGRSLRPILGRQPRYHLIDTKLPRRYHDIDDLMLHGMMELLVSYVEIEMNGEDVIDKMVRRLHQKRDDIDDFERSLTRRHQAALVEALDIYRWWKYQRAGDWDAYDREGARRRKSVQNPFPEYDENGIFPQSHFCMVVLEAESLHQIESNLHATDQKMLHRLIDVRQSLWM